MIMRRRYLLFLDEIETDAREIDGSDADIRTQLLQLSNKINMWVIRERISIGIDEPGEEDAISQGSKSQDS